MGSKVQRFWVAGFKGFSFWMLVTGFWQPQRAALLFYWIGISGFRRFSRTRTIFYSAILFVFVLVLVLVLGSRPILPMDTDTLIMDHSNTPILNIHGY
jgi:hypothetical protein